MVYGLRFTVYGLRFTVYGLRLSGRIFFLGEKGDFMILTFKQGWGAGAGSAFLDPWKNYLFYFFGSFTLVVCRKKIFCQ